MGNTFSQIYIHIVFAVKNRNALIHESWDDELYKYITGIVQNKGQKMLAINGVADHVHFLISINPTCCISDLVREIKKATYIFIRENRFCPYKFEWQQGFGAFSYAKQQSNNVIRYIQNQKEHHKKVLFKNEYIQLMDELEVDYNREYLFDWLMD